jgi:hypothetical protein
MPGLKTTKKNSNGQQKKFNCAHCGKNFQNAQGLSGHIRYRHSSRKAPAANVEREAAQKLQVNAPAPVVNTGAREHLQAAFAMLSQRDREIDGEIARLEALKAEKEIVRKELEAVNTALQVFGGRESAIYEEVQTEQAKGDIPLDTQHAVLSAKEDSSQTRPTESPEANAVPQSSDGQGSVAPNAKPAQNGKSSGTRARRTPEFAGNKTEFVRAVVQFRGAAGAKPKDIDQVFAQRHIEKSKNAIYNALDSLVRQNKLKKKDGQYFYAEGPGK